ncbi:phosphatidylinositol transfer CSR1 protein [Rutstroemia sp. NJR-2017a BBW]|nr:phosphatidylinositol transfer CSR1 protein [Rutstroemia sp. NJR-2017a BBW]
MRWRALDMHVDDDIMKNGELAALEDEKSTDASKKKLAEGFLAQMRSGKSFLHGHDKISPDVLGATCRHSCKHFVG